MDNRKTFCSKCEEPAVHAITVRDASFAVVHPAQKDMRGVRIVRFCEEHWGELERLLPAA